MPRNNEKVDYGLGLGVHTVRRVRDSLGALFNFAVDMQFIPSSPVRKTRVPPAPRSTVNPLTFEEAWAFTSVKDRVWYGNAHVFDLHTGLRPQELMALIEDDIDFGTGTLRIERACKWLGGSFSGFGPVKTRASERVIELAPDHLEFLRDHLKNLKRHAEVRAKDGRWCGEPKVEEWLQKYRPKQRHLYKNTCLVFPSRRGNVPNIIAPRKSFQAMLRYMGLTGNRLKVRWYDLRHTHATLLLTLGVPDHEVAARLGHSVKTLNETYAHVLPERQRLASSFFVSLLPLHTSDSLAKADVRQHFRRFLGRLNSNLEANLLGLLKQADSSLTKSTEHLLEHKRTL